MRPASFADNADAETSPFAGLHVVADQLWIAPVFEGLIARFLVPPGTSSVALVSKTARPSDVFGTHDDRPLGVCLASLAIVDGINRELPISLDDPRLDKGVYGLEAGPCRWTSGCTPLPAEVIASRPKGFFLRVELAREPIC